MKYLVFGWCLLCAIGCAYFSLVVFPKIAPSLNRHLPEKRTLLDRILTPIPGGRYDSPQNLAYARLCAFIAIAMVIFMVAIIIASAFTDVTNVLQPNILQTVRH